MPRNKPSKNTAPQPATLYDCDQCPAFCCTVYERVAVTPRDVKRLAKHFGVDIETAKDRYTKMWEKERILKRQNDPVLEETCHFLDLETRSCTIYEARPEACRDYPGEKRCPYYDLLQFEQRHQDDATALPLVNIEFREWPGAQIPVESEN